jgi:hypothetical protein
MVLINTLANVVYKVVVGFLSCKFYFLGEIGLLKLRINAFERTLEPYAMGSPVPPTISLLDFPLLLTF